MLETLDIFRTASAMASHAGARQAVVARNIANADTPNFRAQDVTPFARAYENTTHQLRATRPDHINTRASTFAAQIIDTGAEPSPNGNTVALEDELLKSVSVSRDHDKALAIYRHAMTVLRTSLGKL
ncbi:flagellar basal-body rod protein FlgB [Yoonia tamlensis]|uniref:Flagellar basal-body rod protein FlgB n=1 Tax=Yoonia tamlensis TaxID=390270 RepID=A0A1I6HBC3_9RHOB|nr:FlgB family protein [Yoonia tamlensis]SFR51752.1 flagellar basal-body rod protein FlgB [Yoonia tamlensis]